MKPFSIAALQLNLDYSNNQDLVVEKTKQAVKRYPWIQMVILNELAVGGSSRSLEFSLEKQLPIFQKIAKELKIWYLPGSFYHHLGQKITNVAPVISPKGDVVTNCTKIYHFLPLLIFFQWVFYFLFIITVFSKALIWVILVMVEFWLPQQIQ